MGTIGSEAGLVALFSRRIVAYTSRQISKPAIRGDRNMTVVLATVCQEGIVLGSDSQITDKGRGMTYPAEKLHPLGELAAWGGSGARSVLFDVERTFSEHSA